MMPEMGARGPAPAGFAEQIKDALEHLYDLPYLQAHPLAAACASGAEPAGLGLRRELAAAIDRLDAHDEPSRAPQSRLAQLLRLHYLEGLTVQDTALELDLSVRQAFRDLRRAEESLAALLWPSLAAAEPQDQAAVFEAEIDRLQSQTVALDAATLVENAGQAVGRLAEQRGLQIEVQAPAQPLLVWADAGLARQLLIHTLSQIIQQAGPGTLRVVLAGDGPVPVLTISCPPCPGSDLGVGGLAEQLAARVGWSFAPAAGAAAGLALRLGRPGPRLLIIDDNQGLLDLLERYLAGLPYRVSVTRNSRAGLLLAEELLPDAIIVDIMMPEMDGWELLQRLRANPHTTSIPVIVCSVLSDPELAYSLGASLCLRKPVEREDFLSALRRLRLL